MNYNITNINNLRVDNNQLIFDGTIIREDETKAEVTITIRDLKEASFKFSNSIPIRDGIVEFKLGTINDEFFLLKHKD